MEWRESVDQMYSDEIERHYEAGGSEVLGQSLEPRSAAMLLDLLAELGVSSASHILDVGSRDGRHIHAVRERFGCVVTGVEPAIGNLNRMRRNVPTAVSSTARGVAEAFPFADTSFDLLWVRDVLVHVAALDDALAEMRRALAPDGAVLIYHTLATETFSDADAEGVCGPAGIWRPNLDRATFEASVASAGFAIEANERIGGEWVEHNLESDGPEALDRLLAVGRLVRKPAHYRQLLGDAIYEIELADRLYSIFQILGKLEANVYILRQS